METPFPLKNGSPARSPSEASHVAEIMEFPLFGRSHSPDSISRNFTNITQPNKNDPSCYVKQLRFS